MKEFIELLGKHRTCENIGIKSITPVQGGYLLVVSYIWGIGPIASFLEEAVLIVQDEYGPNAGKCHLGWTHKISESGDED